jgi:hypothetical protein
VEEGQDEVTFTEGERRRRDRVAVRVDLAAEGEGMDREERFGSACVLCGAR